IGSHSAYLASSAAFAYQPATLTATYWHSETGSTWSFYRQSGQVAHEGAAKLTQVGGVWTLAPGYWAGLTFTPAAIPLEHLGQLSEGFAGRHVYLAGDALEEPGLRAGTCELEVDLSEEAILAVTFS